MTRDELVAALAKHGPAALEAARKEADAMSVVFSNDLSYLGGCVSFHVRRLMLLDSLRSHGWNLSKTGEALHMGSNSHVLRAIRELALTGEYEAAKAAGIPRRGGRQKREASR